MISSADPDYTISSLKSGDVTATTLTIRRFHETFPQEFETIITTRSGAIQYQLRTVVKQKKEFHLETIDSPQWILIPPKLQSYANEHRLNIRCAVFVPRDAVTTFIDELTMSRAKASTSDSQPKFDFLNIVGVHKDQQDVVENQDDVSVLIGRRRRTRNGHVIYHVGLSTRNATPAFEGIYQCILERHYDKLMALSKIKFTGSGALLPEIPVIELISCERDNYDPQTATITLTEGVSTCLRCRALAESAPEVAVYYGGRDEELGSRKNDSSKAVVGVTKYLNLVDAGVVETTYMFQNPKSHLLEGSYYCKASNLFGTARIDFKITFR